MYININLLVIISLLNRSVISKYDICIFITFAQSPPSILIMSSYLEAFSCPATVTKSFDKSADTITLLQRRSYYVKIEDIFRVNLTVLL
jgi:hypothetical protein